MPSGIRVLACSLLALSLSACVASDPTMNLGSADTSQSPDTPVIAVLGDSNDPAQEAPLADPGTPIVYSGIGVPVKAPRLSASPQQQTANIGENAPLAVTSEDTNQVAAGNVIQASTASSGAQLQSPELTAQSTDANQQTTGTLEVAAVSPTVETLPESAPVSQNESKKIGLLARLFGNSSATPTKPQTTTLRPKPRVQPQSRSGRDNDGSTRVASARTKTKKKSSARQKIVLSNVQGSRANAGTLPGVKSNSELFGLGSGQAGSSTNGKNATQLAAVGSFGRLSPNGLRVQHAKVQVACLKPEVLRILKIVERRYGSKPIITSGYRSPKRNRRAGGARNSQHIFCKAVDIQVEGVSKWQLAKYLRTIPGRGGVGTYCRTKSVHIDVGSKRDWHHPCRRSKVRKRKKKA